MNFTAIVHGDIGTLLADYLSLPSLTAWSRCDHNGRTIVHHKFSHMKRIDLREQMNMSLINFAHMCERLRGIEVLQWSLDHAVWTNVDGTVNLRTAHSFLRFLKANARSLRVIQQTRTKYHAAGSPLPASFDKKVLQEAFLNYCVLPVLNFSRDSPHLRVMEVASGVALIPRPRGFIPFPGKLQPIKLTHDQILGAVPYITKEEDKFYQQLHAETARQAAKSINKQPPKPAAAKNELSQPYTLLSVVQSITHQSEISSLFEQSPEVLVCTLNAGVHAEMKSDDDNSEQRPHSIRISAPSRPFTLTQNISDSLISLTLTFGRQQFPIQVELRLPNLRELLLHIRPPAVTDFVFVCPELIKADVQCVCLLNHLAPIDQPAKFVSTPPSIITSLRHSPKLRYLIFIGFGADLLDLTTILSDDEKRDMDVKAAALGQTTLFGALPAEENARASHLLRIMYYAISLLPCASHLHMIDDITSRLTFTEFLTLFPSIRSMSFIPFWSPQYSEGIVWMRPPRELDFMQPYYSKQQIIKKYEQDANPIDVTKELFVKDKEKSTEYLHLADAEMPFDMKASRLCLDKGIYTKLLCLFLHGPTKVESTALTLLLRESRSLAHVSLMQLEGIDNEVFTSFPADYILPSLATLRIKHPCSAERSQSVNMNVIDELVRFCPSMEHFELIVPVAVNEYEPANSAVLADHRHLLDVLTANGTDAAAAASAGSVSWPRLRELTLNAFVDSPSLLVELEAFVKSRQAKSDKGEFLLNLVTIPTSLGPFNNMTASWQVSAGRKPIDVVATAGSVGENVDAGASATTASDVIPLIHRYEERSCHRELCRYHSQPPQLVLEEQEAQ